MTAIKQNVDRAIQEWLDAKTRLSGSQCTRRNYWDNIRWFRAWLQERNLDLDSEDSFELATQLERWASRHNPAPKTFNDRVIVISSFYRFAWKRHLLNINNPADLVERVKVQPYVDSRALDFEELRQKLAAIDRSTLKGKRDFAFLSVALQTGRRRTELVQLRMGDLDIKGNRITITWRRCKGGRKMVDTLPVACSHALLDYLITVYGSSLATAQPESAVWISLGPPSVRGRPCSSTTLFYICRDRLNITSIHRLRHTFAKAMEEVGAKMSDIQARLGHSSLATTGAYLTALRQSENPCGDAVAELFGLSDASNHIPEPMPPRRCAECGCQFDMFQQEEQLRLYCSKQCLWRAQRRRKRERARRNASGDTAYAAIGVASEPADMSGKEVEQQLLLWEL
ncbi:MAG TPA: tyrosine-type recombinase/integrase [Roseiflexaceae bacterium]|nr:tyrosine-type recombinase/integrase [Roseiflexaceae bacterium]